MKIECTKRIFEHLLANHSQISSKSVDPLLRYSQCQISDQYCQELTNQFNFFSINFCYLNDYKCLTYGLIILGLIIIMRTMDYCSDKYISPALDKLSKILKLSQSLAGVTLLAFSNGVTDLVTSVIASKQKGGTLLMIGALFGASTFALNVILAIVIWARPKKVIDRLERGNFKRDISFYIAGVGFLIVAGFFYFSFLLVGIGLLLIYGAFLTLVFCQEKYKYKREWELKEKIVNFLEDDRQRNEVQEDDQSINVEDISVASGLKLNDDNDANENDQNSQEGNELYTYVVDKPFEDRGIFLKLLFPFERIVFFMIQLILPSDVIPDEVDPKQEPSQIHDPLTPTNSAQFLKMDIFKIILYSFTLPYFLLYSMNLLLVDIIYLPSLSLTVSPCLLLLPLQLITIYLRIRHHQTLIVQRGRILVLFLACFGGIQLLSFCVDIVIDMIQFLKVFTGASDIYMGVTILGIGNSFVDLFVDRALALQGNEIMALTGLFTGQMLNYLVGFGAGSLVKYFSGIGHDFHLFDLQTLGSEGPLMAFIILLFNFLTLAYIFYTLQNGILTKSNAKFGIVLYSFAFVLLLGIELSKGL